jgi:hypothetical protein
MTNNLLTDDLSQPLNGVSRANIDINSGAGSVAIDALLNGEQVLARADTFGRMSSSAPATRRWRIAH